MVFISYLENNKCNCLDSNYLKVIKLLGHWTWDLGPVSQKSRELFGPEKPFVKYNLLIL